MSDIPEADAAANIRKLQQQKLARLDKIFAAKKVGEECPACRNTAWFVPHVEVRLHIKAGEQEITPPVAFLTCANCGFLRIHNMLVLDAGSGVP